MKSSIVCVLFAFCSLCGACTPGSANPVAEEEENAGGGGGAATGGRAAQPSNPVGGSGGLQTSGGGTGGGGTSGSGGIKGEGGASSSGGNTAGGAAGQSVNGGAAGGTAVNNASLYAWDDFSSPAGDITANSSNSFFDLGKASGKGWGRGWDQGEHSAPGYYAFANTKPLTFATLATSGNYLLRRRWDLGRNVDLKLPALLPMVQNDQIAKAGTVIWMSVLVRLDGTTVTQNNDLVLVTLHRSGLGYHYYGSDSAWVAGVWPSKGVNNWSLWVGSGTSEPLPNASNAQTQQAAHMSNKPAIVGTTNLIVVKVEISGGASDKVSLYVDPPALGGAVLETPDAVAMTGQSARFRTFAVASSTGDDRPFPASFDEVRIGPTFASVTPTR